MPEGTEPVEDPRRIRGKDKEGATNRNHYGPDCKHHHPSTTAVPCLTKGTEHNLQ